MYIKNTQTPLLNRTSNTKLYIKFDINNLEFHLKLTKLSSKIIDIFLDTLLRNLKIKDF